MRKSLAELICDLEKVCEEIDTQEGSEIPPELIGRFEDKQLELSDKVDNWISYLKALDSQAAFYKEFVDSFTRKLKTVERLKVALKEHVKSVVELNPEIKLRGTLGVLSSQRNSQPSLQLQDPLFQPFYINVSREDLEAYPEALKYVEERPIKTFNLEALREDLKEGKDLPWAKLVTGTHLRIR